MNTRELLQGIWGWVLSLISNLIGGGSTPAADAIWKGVMFVPATPGMPNNKGVSSQLGYRGCHGSSNENAIRLDMLQCVANWGGNVLIYIRGEFCRPNVVLDMCLNGRAHPTDGYYFPIAAPTSSGEVDWARVDRLRSEATPRRARRGRELSRSGGTSPPGTGKAREGRKWRINYDWNGNLWLGNRCI